MSWKEVVGFLSPLIFFVAGMVLLALSTLAYGAIASAVEGTRAAMAAGGIQEANYTGLAWEFTATRLIIFVSGLLSIVISVGIIWLRRR